MSAELIVISWRDIPAQVNAKHGRSVERSVLPSRFQTAIDRAAMRAGLEDSESYIEQWQRSSRPCGGDLGLEVRQEVSNLLARFSSERLSELVENNGYQKENATT